MIGTFLSPKGTLDAPGFIKAGILLILAGFIILAAGYRLNFNGVLVSLLLGYPWICIWIKRLRHGGTSPWILFAYLALYAVLFLVFYLVSFFMLSGDEMKSLISQAMSQEITTDEFSALMNDAIDPSIMIRNIGLSGLLSSLLALFIGNAATPKSAVAD